MQYLAALASFGFGESAIPEILMLIYPNTSLLAIREIFATPWSVVT